MNNTRGFTIIRVIARLNIGGPAIQAILMTEAFRKRSWQSLLATGEIAPGEGSLESMAAERKIDLIKIPSLSRRVSVGADCRALWHLVRLFRRERPAIVHTHTAKAGALGRLAAILTGVPVRVHTFHGHTFQGYFSRRVSRVVLGIERFLARHTDCVIALSAAQRRDLVEMYRIAPAAKVVTIPLGFQLEEFLRVNGPDGAMRARLNSENATVVVGWVGRLTAVKAPLLFLESALRFEAESRSVRFVMVGDGELRDDCEAVIRRAGAASRIRITGWRGAMAPVYAGLDLLVLTSVAEGTPLALLEAMAAGRPIIAVDVGGVRDLMVGSGRPREPERRWVEYENGILVPRDSLAIADAIEYLLQRPELRRDMGCAGREFVRHRYSSERLAADLEQLYVRLAREKNCVSLEDDFASPSEPAVV